MPAGALPALSPAPVPISEQQNYIITKNPFKTVTKTQSKPGMEARGLPQVPGWAGLRLLLSELVSGIISHPVICLSHDGHSILPPPEPQPL